MRVECDRAVPEVPLHINEAVVEDEARKHRTKRQHAQRNEHRPRAFVRMIARRSLGWMDMMAVAVRFRLLARVLGVGVIVMIAMDRVPDMLRPRPARPAAARSADRRGGKGVVSTCRSQWWPHH